MAIQIGKIFDKDVLYGIIILIIIIFIVVIAMFCDMSMRYEGNEYMMPIPHGIFPFSVFIINLDRSPERYEYITKQLNRIGITSYERFRAIDGAKMTKEELKELNLSDLIQKKAELGCAASHLKIWKKIVEEKRDWTLILEDDVEFHPDFINLFNRYWEHVPKDATIIYPGYWIFEDFLYTSDDLIQETGVVCLHAYMINYEGAKYFLDNINTLYFPIDVMLFNNFKFSKIASLSDRKKSYVFNGYAKIDNIIPNDFRTQNNLLGHGIVYQNRNIFKSTINQWFR